MRDIYIKPSMEIDCFEIEDIITLSAGGGNGGEVPDESSTDASGTETSTDHEPEDITGGAGFDSDIMGGSDFQEMLENLYQNFIKYI